MKFEKDGIIHATTNPIVADALKSSGYVEVDETVVKSDETDEVAKRGRKKTTE